MIQEVNEYLYRRVAIASGGRMSHVGIVFKDNTDNWYVAESTTPRSTKTSLCEYIKGGNRNQIVVRRLRNGLSEAQIAKLRLATDQRMNIEYDYTFNLDDKRTQFCSKFVFEAYQQALGAEVGEVETLGELMARLKVRSDFLSEFMFWKLWFWGNIPLKQKTVTPESQYRDPRLVTVFDNFSR